MPPRVHVLHRSVAELDRDELRSGKQPLGLNHRRLDGSRWSSSAQKLSDTNDGVEFAGDVQKKFALHAFPRG